MAIATVTAAIAGLKTTIDLAKAAIAARDELKLAEAQQAINDRIFDLQNAALALQERHSAARDEIEDLKEDLRAERAKIAELERIAAERSNYRLRDIGRGAYVYKYAPAAAESPDSPIDPDHYICQSCFDGPGKRKVVLVYSAGIPGGVHRVAPWWTCPVCKQTASEP